MKKKKIIFWSIVGIFIVALLVGAIFYFWPKQNVFLEENHSTEVVNENIDNADENESIEDNQNNSDNNTLDDPEDVEQPSSNNSSVEKENDVQNNSDIPISNTTTIDNGNNGSNANNSSNNNNNNSEPNLPVEETPVEEKPSEPSVEKTWTDSEIETYVKQFITDFRLDYKSLNECEKAGEEWQEYGWHYVCTTYPIPNTNIVATMLSIDTKNIKCDGERTGSHEYNPHNPKIGNVAYLRSLGYKCENIYGDIY